MSPDLIAVHDRARGIRKLEHQGRRPDRNNSPNSLSSATIYLSRSHMDASLICRQVLTMTAMSREPAQRAVQVRRIGTALVRKMTVLDGT